MGNYMAGAVRNNTGGFTITATDMIESITTEELVSQQAFKNKSTWDFSNIWTYIYHINWDYPVLRSIYGRNAVEIDVVVYNPYKNGAPTVQLGNLYMGSLDHEDRGIDSIFYKNASNEVVSNYADIVASEYADTSVIEFTYSIMASDYIDVMISNTSNGLVSSVLFGEIIRGDGTHETITYYDKYTDNTNNDIHIHEELVAETYGLVITYEYREFNLTLNSTLTADAGTDGVQDDDFVTVVLVHTNSAGIVDYAYSIDMKNNETYTFANIFNGVLDSVYTYTYAGVDYDFTVDDYGTWSVYLYYPMFYVNETDKTTITNANITYNPTISRVKVTSGDYAGYYYNITADNTVIIGGVTYYIDTTTTIGTSKLYTNAACTTEVSAFSYTLNADSDYYDNYATINNSNVAFNYIGSFNLDTISRDIVIDITVNKPYEYWLHNSSSNM